MLTSLSGPSASPSMALGISKEQPQFPPLGLAPRTLLYWQGLPLCLFAPWHGAPPLHVHYMVAECVVSIQESDCLPKGPAGKETGIKGSRAPQGLSRESRESESALLGRIQREWTLGDGRI